MSKNKEVTKLHKPHYVENEYGHNDSMLVRKINALIDVVNYQQREIAKLKKIIKNK